MMVKTPIMNVEIEPQKLKNRKYGNLAALDSSHIGWFIPPCVQRGTRMYEGKSKLEKLKVANPRTKSRLPRDGGEAVRKRLGSHQDQDQLCAHKSCPLLIHFRRCSLDIIQEDPSLSASNALVAYQAKANCKTSKDHGSLGA